MHACPWHSPPTRQLLRSLLESQAALSSRWPERVHEFISRASSKEWTSSSLDVTACHPSNWVDTVLSKLTPWEINMEPENHWVVDEHLLPKVCFQVPC